MSDSKKGGGVVGYRYFFGIHMGLCRGPVDEIVEVTVGDRRVFPVGTTTTTTDPVYTPPDAEGGGAGWGTVPPDSP